MAAPKPNKKIDDFLGWGEDDPDPFKLDKADDELDDLFKIEIPDPLDDLFKGEGGKWKRLW